MEERDQHGARLHEIHFMSAEGRVLHGLLNLQHHVGTCVDLLRALDDLGTRPTVLIVGDVDPPSRTAFDENLEPHLTVFSNGLGSSGDSPFRRHDLS